MAINQKLQHTLKKAKLKTHQTTPNQLPRDKETNRIRLKRLYFQMLKISGNLKLIDMLKALIENVDYMHEQLKNLGKIRKNHRSIKIPD